MKTLMSFIYNIEKDLNKMDITLVDCDSGNKKHISYPYIKNIPYNYKDYFVVESDYTEDFCKIFISQKGECLCD